MPVIDNIANFKTMPNHPKFWPALLFVLFLTACSENVNLIDNNTPYSTFNISDIKIENYVNRLYIDIIAREPLDTELEAEVRLLKESGLSMESRDSIITRLMTDTSFRENEFSYKAAYVQNLYNLAKVRCLESVADSEIQQQIGIARNGALKDSLEENWDGYYEKLNTIRRYKAVLDSRPALYNGEIKYHQMYTFIIDNGIYDRINMNTFNFLRAAFDELLWRLPSEQEFDRAFAMIEYNQTEEIFGKLGSNKTDFIQILTNSPSMLEGMVRWAYQVFLKRPPTEDEVVTLLPRYVEEKDINLIIKEILLTDEYANFR